MNTGKIDLIIILVIILSIAYFAVNKQNQSYLMNAKAYEICKSFKIDNCIDFNKCYELEKRLLKNNFL